MSHFHVAIPPAVEPKLNDYEQLVRTEWMTRDEVRHAFGSLPPAIAEQAVAFLDQVLTPGSQPVVASATAGRPGEAADDQEAPRDVTLAEERAARRREWARQSRPASSPTQQPPAGRPASRPRQP